MSNSWSQASGVFQLYSNALAGLGQHLTEPLWQSLMAELRGCRGKIVVTGVGTSGIAARKIAHMLACVEHPAIWLSAADAAHGDGCGWLSSRALAPDGTDQPMNLQRKTMYRDIDGFDAAEIPAVMASFVSLFLRTEAVRQFGLPIAEFFIWSDDWEYTRRISRAKPCYVIPASRVVHAMQNPGVVNIARDVPARWARYRYFYRNDVVLYRREGLSGWLWLLAKDSWHTVQVLRDRQGCRAERIKIIWKGFAAGVRFRPQIPYLP